MALVLHCRTGEVRVNGEPVVGTILIPMDSVIEPMIGAQFEVLLAHRIAETDPEAPSGVAPIRADFPPNCFLVETEVSESGSRRWLLQTPDGALQFVCHGACAIPVT